MPEHLRASAPDTLLKFLVAALPQWKTKTLKQRLRGRYVQVNGEVVTHHAHALDVGDEVLVHETPQAIAKPGAGIHVLFEDASFIAIDKPAGLLSVGTQRNKTRHALALVRDAMRKGDKLWPAHRLDKATSGVLLFARSREVCKELQKNWIAADKVYFAVVEGIPKPPDGLIDQPLYEDARLDVSVRSHPDAKDARTRYWTRKTGPRRALVECHLDTGRRHQIRAHLAWLGTPIVGDQRYGTKASRMALHAHKLTFDHPVTGESLSIVAKTPSVFAKLVRSPEPGTRS